jgi:anion-transporting  ArsA/GET3 family ATPase
MSEFFGGRLLRWLTLPYRVGGKRSVRMINFASKPFYQLADRVLGSEFLKDIAEFFLNFQTMYDGFVTRARAVERLLHHRRTTFVVVSTLETAPLHEARFFCDELRERGFDLSALILNKTLPAFLLEDDGRAAADALLRDAESIGNALEQVDPRLSECERDSRVLRTAAETFLDYRTVAAHEAELRAELARAPEIVVNVPGLEDDVHDVTGLARVGERLFSTP